MPPSINGTDVSPYRVGSHAGQMYLTAKAAVKALAEPLRRMREIHAREPWGNDAAGEAFRDSYLGADGEPVGEALAEGSENLLRAVRDVAENAGIGAYTTAKVDEHIADQLEALEEAAEEESDLPDGDDGDASHALAVQRTMYRVADPYVDPGTQQAATFRSGDRSRPEFPHERRWRGISGMSGAQRRLSPPAISQLFQGWLRGVRGSDTPHRYFALGASGSALRRQRELAQQRGVPPPGLTGTSGEPDRMFALGASGSELQAKQELAEGLGQQGVPPPVSTQAGGGSVPGGPPADTADVSAGSEPAGASEGTAGEGPADQPETDGAVGTTHMNKIDPRESAAPVSASTEGTSTDTSAREADAGDAGEPGIPESKAQKEPREELPAHQDRPGGEPANRVVSPWAAGRLLRTPEVYVGRRVDLLSGTEPPAAA